MSHPVLDALWDDPKPKSQGATAIDHLWDVPQKAQSPAAAAGRLPAIQKAGDEALGQAIQDQRPGALATALTGAESAVRGVPFGVGTRAMALARAGGSHLPDMGKPVGYADALQEQADRQHAFAQENPRSAVALPMLGAQLAFSQLPTKALNLMGGQVGGRVGAGIAGGTISAGERLLSPDHPNESLADKLAEAGKAGVVGGTLAAAVPSVMGSRLGRAAVGGGIGAFLAPENHRIAGGAAGAAAGAFAPEIVQGAGDLAARAVGHPTALTDVGNAVGNRGAAAKELSGVDDLAKPIGTMVGATSKSGPQKIAQAQQFKEASDQLYDVARQDTHLMTDPKTVAMLKDPDVQKVFRAVEDIRLANGRPFPQSVAGQQAVPSSIVQANGQPFMSSQPVMQSVPDPEALHLAKQILRVTVDNGYDKGTPISVAEAMRVTPKLQALTDHLHTSSQPYAEADRFFQLGKTAEDANALGYGAGKAGMRNPGPNALGTKDVAGVRQFAATQADPELQDVASQGVREGARRELTQTFATRPLSGGRAGILASAGFDPSIPAAREQRALALGADAPAYERTLGNAAKSVADENTPSAFRQALRSIPLAGRVVAATPPTANAGIKALQTPAGLDMIRQAQENPAAFQSTLSSSTRGKSRLEMLRILTQLGLTTTNSPFANP